MDHNRPPEVMQGILHTTLAGPLIPAFLIDANGRVAAEFRGWRLYERAWPGYDLI